MKYDIGRHEGGGSPEARAEPPHPAEGLHATTPTQTLRGGLVVIGSARWSLESYVPDSWRRRSDASDGGCCSLKGWTLTGCSRPGSDSLRRFWQHGAQKLFGWLEAGIPKSEPTDFLNITLATRRDVVRVFSARCSSGSALFTRPVASLLDRAARWTLAYFLSHHPRGFWAVLNGAGRESAALFCFIYLLLAAHGPGRLALDSLLFRKPGEMKAPNVERPSDEIS